MAHLIDVRIQSDLMSALLAFAQDKDQRVYFNGFAIYCMEIACSFFKVYEDQLKTIPPGLQENSLVKFNNLMLQSDRSIGEYRDKRKIHTDFQEFFMHVNGNLGDEHLREKLRDSEIECAILKKELQKYKQMVDQVQGPLDSIKNNIDDLNIKVTHEIQQNDTILQLVHKNQLWISSFVLDLKGALSELKKSDKIDDEKYNKFFSLIQARLDVIDQISGVGSNEDAMVIFVDGLQKQIERMKLEIDELKKAGSSAAVPQPPVALSDVTKDLLKICGNYHDLKFPLKIPELFTDVQIASLKNDFSGLDSELSNLLENILLFCRDSFCFFHTLENFKKKKIDDVLKQSNINSVKNKIKNLKIKTFFDNTILCPIYIVENLNNVFKKNFYLDKFLSFKLEKLDLNGDQIQIGGSDIHNVELKIISSDNPNFQWKTSFLHAECTYHDMKHQLMFMFTLHLLRLVQFLSENLKDDASSIKKSIDETFPVMFDIFCNVMNENKNAIQSTALTQEYRNLISDFFSEYPKNDQRKAMYPLKLFHMGAYMKYTPRSYPYLHDSDKKEINISVYDSNKNEMCKKYKMDQEQIYTQVFYILLQAFKDSTVTPGTSIIFQTYS